MNRATLKIGAIVSAWIFAYFAWRLTEPILKLPTSNIQSLGYFSFAIAILTAGIITICAILRP